MLNIKRNLFFTSHGSEKLSLHNIGNTTTERSPEFILHLYLVSHFLLCPLSSPLFPFLLFLRSDEADDDDDADDGDDGRQRNHDDDDEEDLRLRQQRP